MAAPRLVSVRILKNHGALVVYRSTRRGDVRRFERPDGSLSVPEAAHLLRTNRNMVRRMERAGRISIRRSGGRMRVPLAECRLLLSLRVDQRATYDPRKYANA